MRKPTETCGKRSHHAPRGKAKVPGGSYSSLDRITHEERLVNHNEFGGYNSPMGGGMSVHGGSRALNSRLKALTLMDLGVNVM